MPAAQAVVSTKGSKIASAKSIAELKDAKLGAQVGTTSYTVITDQIQPTPKPAPYDTNDLAVQALKNGQIDGIVVTCRRPSTWSRRRTSTATFTTMNTTSSSVVMTVTVVNRRMTSLAVSGRCQSRCNVPGGRAVPRTTDVLATLVRARGASDGPHAGAGGDAVSGGEPA